MVETGTNTELAKTRGKITTKPAVTVQVAVEEERLARVAPELAARRQRAQTPAQLVVDDPAAFAPEPVRRLRDRHGQRIRLRLPRQPDLDRDPHLPAAMLPESFRRLPDT
jgi:hypothetical protein